MSRLWRAGALTHSWHLMFLSEGLKEPRPVCFTHRKRVQWRMMTREWGEDRVWGGSCRLGPSAGGGSAPEGMGKNSPFSTSCLLLGRVPACTLTLTCLLLFDDDHRNTEANLLDRAPCATGNWYCSGKKHLLYFRCLLSLFLVLW